MERNGACALCADAYEGIGHNPEPLGDHDERVCHECNDRFVIPARLGLYTSAQVRALRILMGHLGPVERA